MSYVPVMLLNESIDARKPSSTPRPKLGVGHVVAVGSIGNQLRNHEPNPEGRTSSKQSQSSPGAIESRRARHFTKQLNGEEDAVERSIAPEIDSEAEPQACHHQAHIMGEGTSTSQDSFCEEKIAHEREEGIRGLGVRCRKEQAGRRQYMKYACN